MFMSWLLYLMGKELPVALNIEDWVVLQDGVDAIEKRTILCPYQQSNQNSLVIQPVAYSLYPLTLCTIPAQVAGT